MSVHPWWISSSNAAERSGAIVASGEHSYDMVTLMAFDGENRNSMNSMGSLIFHGISWDIPSGND